MIGWSYKLGPIAFAVCFARVSELQKAAGQKRRSQRPQPHRTARAHVSAH